MKTIGTFKPDNLYADIGIQEIRETREIPMGTAVKRGNILGKDFKPILSGGTVDSIALEDIAADAAIRVCTVAESGGFNINALSTGDSSTPADWKDDLRHTCQIYLRHPAP